MRSTQSEPHNLTMEILDNTTDEESMDGSFFMLQLNEKLIDSQLEECLTFSYILRIRQNSEKLNFMTISNKY